MAFVGSLAWVRALTHHLLDLLSLANPSISLRFSFPISKIEISSICFAESRENWRIKKSLPLAIVVKLSIRKLNVEIYGWFLYGLHAGKYH